MIIDRAPFSLYLRNIHHVVMSMSMVFIIVTVVITASVMVVTVVRAQAVEQDRQ